MPYFHNDKINLLFVHIPRTGGTSIEHYFSDKFQIPLNTKSIYSNPADVKRGGISYQHQTQLIIVRLENNREDMRALGYEDFDLDLCKSYHIKEYHEFFSKETVELINAFYAEDFARFGYERLDPANFPSFSS